MFNLFLFLSHLSVLKNLLGLLMFYLLQGFVLWTVEWMDIFDTYVALTELVVVPFIQH